MKSKSGLRAVKKSVHGKRGTVTRTYWVKASPKAEAQKGNRQISAGEMLKRHGLQIAGRGAAHGAGTYAAQLGATRAGTHAGMHFGGRMGKGTAKSPSVGGHLLGGTLGAAGGFLTGTVASATVGRRLAYTGKRGAAIRADYQRATIGGKIASVGVHLAAHTGAWMTSSRAHGAIRRAQKAKTP